MQLPRRQKGEAGESSETVLGPGVGEDACPAGLALELPGLQKEPAFEDALWDLGTGAGITVMPTVKTVI